MKSELSRTMKATSRTDPEHVQVSACGRYRIVKEGTVIDHPDAYRLCMMGVAKPADDECLERLADEGWGPDVFNEKWQAASLQMKEWEQGIRDANTNIPTPQKELNDSRDSDSGSVLHNRQTSED